MTSNELYQSEVFELVALRFELEPGRSPPKAR
jgi:hypothetical protein